MIDVFADVGTRYQIEYMAYDDSMPANIITAHRSIIIVAPCKPGQQLCGLDCSSVPCEALKLFHNPVMNPTFVVPDIGTGTIHLPCTGTAFPARQAAVCSNASMIGSNMCVGITGVDKYSPDLVKVEVKPTACPIFNTPLDIEQSLACPPCVLPLLEVGACAPASYDIIYSYAYPDLDSPSPHTQSVVINSQQSVIFEQLISISVELHLLSDVSDYTTSRLHQALRHVMNELWPPIRQSIEDQFNIGNEGNAVRTEVTYIMLSPTAESDWDVAGNNPSLLTGSAWVHGMVSNSNASLPWLSTSTVVLNVSSAILSAMQSALSVQRPLRTTWLELGLADGGALDGFETTVMPELSMMGNFESISTGTICPLWTDAQVLSLSADVVSQQVTDAIDRLRITVQGTHKALPLVAEIDSLIKMQSLGTAWCELAKEASTTSQAVTVDISDGMELLQNDISSSLQLVLLAESQKSDCLERLNDLTLQQAGAISSTRDDAEALSPTATDAVPVHALGSQVVWQIGSSTPSQVIVDTQGTPAVHLQENPESSNFRSLLESSQFYQQAFDIDNGEEVRPARLDCVQALQQEGCAAVPRVFGRKQSGTTLLGGVLIHQSRTSEFQCSKGFQGKLSFRCSALTPIRGITSQTKACMAEFTVAQPGFGSEPARNGQSSLFNPLLDVEEYYNASNSPFEVDCRGEPRPFQAIDLPGYAPGYPIVMEACADAATTIRALQYVTDSR